MFKYLKYNLLTFVGLSLSLLLMVDQSTPINKIDPKTKQFYKEYINYIPKSCKRHVLRQNKIVIKFETLNTNFIGFCNRVFRERTILLDADFWRWMQPLDQKQLLFHELSHCLLNKNHVKDISNYMYPTQYGIPEEVFIGQVKQDIETYCSNFSYD